MVQFYQGGPKRYDEQVKVSLEEAIERGISAYWTGEPCVRGHMAHRNTSTKRCVICAYQTHKKCMSKRMREESEQAGINNELRRKIEQAQEDMKLTRELEDY